MTDPRVLDVHHHCGSVMDALGGTNALGELAAEEWEQREWDTRARVMANNDVDQAVVIPSHAYLRPDGIVDTRRVNDHIADYRERDPDRFPAALGIVEPLYGARGIEEIDRLADEGRWRGVSIHTRFQGVTTDSPWVSRHVGHMAERGLVPFVHAYAETTQESLWQVDRLAADHPDVTMIILDPFSGHEQTRQCFDVAERRPNLVFETALSYTFKFIEDFAVALGAHRVVYGSDLYSYPLQIERSHLLEQIRASEVLSDADRAAILGGTARKVLGLD
jgi:predicted TIM-barrel fold metal-dependent hydrolase